MDALLGEDETQAKNRIALICQQCRLVNGQAPPGTRSLEEVGKWRCSACGAWNGVESETSRLVQQLTDQNGQSPASPELERDERQSGSDEVANDSAEDAKAGVGASDVAATRVTNDLDKQDEDEDEEDADEDTPAKSTRSKKSGKRK